MSGSGPFGPIFAGVWQSWHPIDDTRYSPRLTRSAGDIPAEPAGACAPAPTPIDAIATAAIVASAQLFPI
jgi:hypothetical protein